MVIVTYPGLFICLLELNFTLNNRGHIKTMPVCSSGTLIIRSAAILKFHAADTRHDILALHSIQTHDMTSHTIIIQCTDTRHDILACHSIQAQDMTPHPVTVYRHRI